MKSQISNVKSQSGFTLLEVVVALAIVGLGVVTLLAIFSQGLRLGARSAASSEALTYGRQLLDEVLARRILTDGTEQASFGGQNRWRLQIQTLREETQLSLSSPWELKELTLEVRYREGVRERLLEMKTLRLVKKTNP